MCVAALLLLLLRYTLPRHSAMLGCFSKWHFDTEKVNKNEELSVEQQLLQLSQAVSTLHFFLVASSSLPVGCNPLFIAFGFG